MLAKNSRRNGGNQPANTFVFHPLQPIYPIATIRKEFPSQTLLGQRKSVVTEARSAGDFVSIRESTGNRKLQGASNVVFAGRKSLLHGKQRVNRGRDAIRSERSLMEKYRLSGRGFRGGSAANVQYGKRLRQMTYEYA